jgi:CRP-like cAMP-binding protein
MQRMETQLSECAFFNGLHTEQLSILAGCASIVRFDPGELILRAGERAEAFYVLRHGKVGIEIDVPGRGIMDVQMLGEGEGLGWSWFFPPYHWQFDARALEPVRALMFDATALRAALESDHELGYAVLARLAQMMGERLQAARLQLLDVHGLLT